MLVFLIVLAVVAVIGLYRTLPADDLDVVEAGLLTVDPGAVGRHTFGDHVVVVEGGEEPSVRVEDEDRVVWSAPVGTSFVTAGRGVVDWTAHRGYFWPSVDLDERFADQEVTAVRVRRGQVVLTGTLAADEQTVAYQATFGERRGGVRLDLAATDDPDGGVTSLGLVSGRTAGAGVHGLGEQFSDFDLDGALVPIVDREQGVGRGEQPLTLLADLTNRAAGGTEATTYAAWSSFVTDDVRGVRLDPDTAGSHAFAVADLRTDDAVGLELWSRTLHAELTSGAEPVQLLARQAAGGDSPRPPRWVEEGAVLGLQGGTGEVRARVAQAQGAGAELSAVWLQDWVGQRRTSFGDRLWWTWQRDTELYPRWRRLVADLRTDGIRTTTYVNPFLVDADKKLEPGLRNLWAEARELDFLVARPDGAPYALDQGDFEAYLIDLTNPRARGWFSDVIADEVLRGGVQGMMADFGEGLPFDAVVRRGDTATAHNRWPLLWARTVREGCVRAQVPDCLVWFRSGALGMEQEAPMFWGGDQMVDFSAEDGLASALSGALSAGVSGWPLVHADVGGYTSVDAVVRDYVRPYDLNARSAELAAFGTMMRSHEGNRPAENRQVYDPDQAADFARATRIYAALARYRHGVVSEAVRTGVPAVRHTWVNYPGSAAAESDRQFFLGDSILVAPVLESEATTVTVSLPPGTWVHLLTGASYPGEKKVEVDAPVGTPAAFVREDDPELTAIRADLSAAGLTDPGRR